MMMMITETNYWGLPNNYMYISQGSSMYCVRNEGGGYAILCTGTYEKAVGVSEIISNYGVHISLTQSSDCISYIIQT